MRAKLRVAAVQFQHKAGDKRYNLSRIALFAERAAAAGAKFVCMPEMCIGGYWHVPNLTPGQLEELAEPEDGPSLREVSRMAELLDIAIGVGWLERHLNGQFYNSFRLCMPDGGGHTHRKLHAFEHAAISSGDQYTVFDTPWGVRMAILICWDNNLVENGRACALAGAEVLLAPHQTGGTASISPRGMKPIPLTLWEKRLTKPEELRRAFAGPNGREWLMRWLPARAHDNGMFVVFSNGVGRDEDEVRTGNSMILDPYGDVVAETDAICDDMVVADLELDLIDGSSGRRWLRGRRPELYGSLVQRRGNELSARATRFGPAG